MVILPGIRVIVRGFLRHLSKKFYVHVLAQCALVCGAHVSKYHLSLILVSLQPYSGNETIVTELY